MTDSTFKIDRLKLYFGDPYFITDTIIIRQPTLGEIIEIGEEKFYKTLNIFITNPTSYRVALWDMGIDWNKISEYELFMMLAPNVDVKAMQLFLPGFFLCRAVLSDETQRVVLSNEYGDLISEEFYSVISIYLRTMFNIFPKVEKAKGKTTKQWMIQEDREKLAKTKEEYSSHLLPLISSCINHPGFKYKKSELKEIGMVEFMDSVKRLQVYESSVALLNGRYSGMIDSSKINVEEFNFMRDLDVNVKIK